MPLRDKKFLICSYYLPPTKTVATLRIFNFHFEANKHFSKIYSITTSNRKHFPKEEYSFNDSNTIEIKTWDIRKFLTNKNQLTPGLKGSQKKSSFFKFVSKLFHSFPFNIFLADGGISYILGGYFKAKKLVIANDIEFIFSSYKPYSDHLICFLLKKWNPNLFWIADFRDIHVDEVRKNIFFPSIQKWFNKKIVTQANVLTTVSQGLAEHFEQFHSDVYVLPNGISILNETNDISTPFKKFTIAYTGSLYEGLRTAEVLFKTIQSLIANKKIDTNDIEIIYAGNDRQLWDSWLIKYQLTGISNSMDSIPFQKSKEIQRRSHLNLLLTWASKSSQGVLTAKIYEYIASKNPILTIINGIEDKEIEKTFSSFSAGEVAYNNEDAEKHIADFLLKLYNDWKIGTPTKNEIAPEQMKNFYWEEMMPKFIDYISKK